MTIEYISAQLKEESQRFERDTLSMGPYDTANFLLLCGEMLLKYVEYSNQQIEPDSQAFLSKSDTSKIDSLFRELGNNFFPMAHTDAQLRYLKIVNAQQYESLNERVENVFINLAQVSETILATNIDINHRNIELSREMLDDLQRLRTEIRDVLNP
jgi:hypothetical protein